MPPRQFAPAKLDAPLPAPWLSTIATMFELGLADPRGCEYHEIEVRTGSIWGGEGHVVKTRGWLLPTRGAGTQWVIGWNGLIYPAVSVGALADVRSDMAALIEQERDAYAKEKAERKDSRYHRFKTTAENYNLSHESATALKVALVLQLGEGVLAKQLWDVVALDESLTKVPDPFLVFAVDWAWNLFERAVTSHMRGDTASALPTARLLAAAAPKIEKEADRRKVERDGRDNQKAPHVSFIDQLQVLIDDETRREALGKRAPLPDAKTLAAMDPVARTKLLVDNLDQVAARQWGQPGGVDLASDPIVTALIETGAPAVEPLIAVLETDMRLTRSVHFWRDFARSRTMLGVHEAAYVALAGILEQPFFGPASTGDNLTARGADGRRTVADHVRAYWDKWKNITLEDRWMMVLADDAAKPDDWLDAAQKMTRPHNVQVRPGSMVWTTTVTNSNGKPGLRGDVLRSRSNPSITDLMIKRLRDPKLPANHACGLVHMFAAWDALAAKPHLKDRLAKTTAANKGQVGEARCIVALVKDLIDAGELGALDTYATWVAAVAPSDDSWGDATVFEPMLEHPARPSIKKAAELLFRDDSPWVPLIGGKRDRDRLLESSLIKVAAFNKHVIAALSVSRVIGTLTMREKGHYKVDYTSGGMMSTATDEKDAPAKGTTQVVRVSDAYASKIAAYHKTAPRFQLYWPDSQRNDALAKMKSWLATQVAK